MLCVLSSLAANIKVKGAVKDKLSKEPLIGATIRLIGTQAGAVTDMDGNFELNAGGVLEGMYDIEIKYVGYKTEVRRKVRVENGKLVILNLELETDAQELADVVVVAKKNRENENMLLLEQQKDLSSAIDTLLSDIEAGRKYMKVYKQMKMYNDTDTNPVLYAKK